MVPRYVEFFGELPHTTNGKIHKANLRQHPISERTWDARAAGYEVIKD